MKHISTLKSLEDYIEVLREELLLYGETLARLDELEEGNWRGDCPPSLSHADQDTAIQIQATRCRRAELENQLARHLGLAEGSKKS